MSTLRQNLKTFLSNARAGNVEGMHAAFDKAIREKLVPMLQNKQREVAQKMFNQQ